MLCISPHLSVSIKFKMIFVSLPQSQMGLFLKVSFSIFGHLKLLESLSQY